MSLNDAVGYFLLAATTTIGIASLGAFAIMFVWVAGRVLLAVILAVPLGIACMIIDSYNNYKQNKLTRLGVTT